MHTLYYSPQSCSLAPHIVLEEIGRPYRLELVTATGGQMTDTPEWGAINPKRRIPALSGVEGSAGGAPGLLTEVPAILLFLAHRYPEAMLLPDDLAAQARALEWMNWLSSAVHAMCYGQIWRPQRFVANPAIFSAVQSTGREILATHHAYIERLMADGRDWAVPGGYSVVDPYLLVFWRWGRRVGFDMRQKCPAWASAMKRVLDRAAVIQVLRSLDLEIEA